MSEGAGADVGETGIEPSIDALLDAETRLAWLRRIYYALDGRWYVKTRDRFGPEIAQEVNEDVVGSLARTQVRVWCELTGVDRIEDCRMLGRFVLDVLDTLYGSWRDAVTIVVDGPDEWAMRHVNCTIFEMGLRAGYDEDPLPGTLPGCGGIRVMAQAWASAAGDFTAEQRPALSPEGRVACRYVFRRA